MPERGISRALRFIPVGTEIAVFLTDDTWVEGVYVRVDGSRLHLEEPHRLIPLENVVDVGRRVKTEPPE